MTEVVEYIQVKQPLALDELKAFVGQYDNISVSATSGSPIKGVCDGRSPVDGCLCYLEELPDPSLRENLNSCVIVTNPKVAAALKGFALIVSDDPRALFIDTLYLLIERIGFHYFSSLVDRQPGIHPDASIDPAAVIEDGVYIGANSSVAAGCVIKRGTAIAEHVIVRENTVIGCDGIALYKARDGRVLCFPHLAGVSIAPNVEIGAGCIIPRGVMKSTRIGEDSVIGNLSNIGHAAQIGEKVWMSVGCMIGGNTTIGSEATLGLGVKVRDNIRVGKGCNVGMGTVVVKSLADGVSAFGNPAKPLRKINAGPVR